MEYNQNQRKPQAANQSNQFDRENNQPQKQAANPRQFGQDRQQGLGKKPQQQGANPYNKPSDPKQQDKSRR